MHCLFPSFGARPQLLAVAHDVYDSHCEHFPVLACTTTLAGSVGFDGETYFHALFSNFYVSIKEIFSCLDFFHKDHLLFDSIIQHPRTYVNKN